MSTTMVATERVEKLKQDILKANRELTSERSHIFTEYYKHSEGEPTILRRAHAYAEVLKKIPISIKDGELIVGSLTSKERGSGVFPEYDYAWLEEELDTISTREVDPYLLTDEDRANIAEDISYWKGKSFDDLIRRTWFEEYGPVMKDAVAAKLINEVHNRPGGRKSLDNEKVLNQGLLAIINEARQKSREFNITTLEDMRKKRFYQSVIICCEAVIDFAKRYAALARELAAKEENPTRKHELETIAQNCDRVPANPASNFYEAMQSFWFIHLSVLLENTEADLSPGRFDQYMYPFYDNDIKANIITEEQARELMGCLWVKFNQVESARDFAMSRQSPGGTMFQNMTIGGQTKDGKSAVNEMSYLVVDTMKRVHLTQPALSLRFVDSLPEDFLIKVAELTSMGGGQPAWYGDKYTIAALQRVGISKDDAYDWIPLGCVEAGIQACAPEYWGYPAYSVGKCMELALNDGVDPLTKKQIGPHTGNPVDFKTYEDLVEALRIQVADATRKIVLHHNITIAYHQEFGPIPLTSSMTKGCLAEGKDVREGGALYQDLQPLAPFGTVSTGNALYAIRKFVYEEKSVSMGELLEALASDYEGKEDLRKMLEAAPKYGNDIDEVDKIVADIYTICNQEAEKHHSPFSTRPLPICYFGVSWNWYFGLAIGATADGRKAFTPTADGSLSPYIGTDVKGPTAVINSASKVDAMPALSTLFNMKFQPSALKTKEDLRKFVQLIKTYFQNDGYQIQFNVVDRETLVDAKNNPHLHRDLLIRVAGYSAHFVDLPAGVKDEIIARTENKL